MAFQSADELEAALDYCVNYTWISGASRDEAEELLHRKPHVYAVSDRGGGAATDFVFTTVRFLNELCEDDHDLEASLDAYRAIMPWSIQLMTGIADRNCGWEAEREAREWLTWFLATFDEHVLILPPTRKSHRLPSFHVMRKERDELCKVLHVYGSWPGCSKETLTDWCYKINPLCAAEWMSDDMLSRYTDWMCLFGEWHVGVPDRLDVMVSFIDRNLVNDDNEDDVFSSIIDLVSKLPMGHWKAVTLLEKALQYFAFTYRGEELEYMLQLARGEDTDDESWQGGASGGIDFSAMSLKELATARFDQDPTEAFLSIQKHYARLFRHNDECLHDHLALLRAATRATCFTENQAHQLRRFLTTCEAAVSDGSDDETHATKPYEFIASYGRAKEACAVLQSWSCAAVDCEFGQWEDLALVQVSNGDVTYVFDVAANAKVLKPLRAFLDSTSCVKVMHDCRGDARVLASRGYRLRHVVDSQMLWNVCHGIRQNISLNDFLRNLVPDQVNVHKDAVNGMYAHNPDVWTDRPLSQQLREYAIADVKPLLDAICELNPTHEELVDAAKRSHQRVYTACGGSNNRLGIPAHTTHVNANKVATRMMSLRDRAALESSAVTALKHKLQREHLFWLESDEVPVAEAMQREDPRTYALSACVDGAPDRVFTTLKYLDTLFDDRNDEAVARTLRTIMPWSIALMTGMAFPKCTQAALSRGRSWLAWILSEFDVDVFHLPPVTKWWSNDESVRSMRERHDSVRIGLHCYFGTEFKRLGIVLAFDVLNPRCAVAWMPDEMLSKFTDWRLDASTGRWRLGVPNSAAVMVNFLQSRLVNSHNADETSSAILKIWAEVPYASRRHALCGTMLREALRCGAFTAQQDNVFHERLLLSKKCSRHVLDDPNDRDMIDYDSMSLKALAKAPFGLNPTKAFLSIQRRCAHILKGYAASRAQIALLRAANGATCFSDNQAYQLRRLLKACFDDSSSSSSEESYGYDYYY